MAEHRGFELASSELLVSLVNRGFLIDQSQEIEKYLDFRGANAATFLQGDLLLRADARKIEVLEEYLHNVQRRIGLISRLNPWQLELHVKRFMVRHQRLLGIGSADADWLTEWLVSAERSGN